MQSRFLYGLLESDKEVLVEFLAFFEEISLFKNILEQLQKGGNRVLPQHIKEGKSLGERLEKRKKEISRQYSLFALRGELIECLCNVLDIALVETYNVFSLHQICLDIEIKALQILKKNNYKFDIKDPNALPKYVVEKLFNQLLDRYKDIDEKEKFIDDLLESISSFDESLQKELLDGLGVDKLTRKTIKEALVAGTFSSVFASAVSFSGFAAYTTATSLLASIVSSVGIKLGFSVYTGLTSIIAVFSNPVILASVVGTLAYKSGKSKDEQIKNEITVMLIGLMIINGQKSDTRDLCEAIELVDFLNVKKKKKPIKNKCELYDISLIPFSKLECDKTPSWLYKNIFEEKSENAFPASKTNEKHDLLDDIFEISVIVLTVGDFLYDVSRLEPEVLKAFDFARTQELSNPLSFAYFAKELNISEGSFQQLKGYVAERIVGQRLQSQGYEVEFPDISNQAGYDLLINGEPYQVKCGVSESLVYEHLEKYPDIPILVNEELGEKFQDIDNVISVDGLTNEYITELTKSQLYLGEEIMDFEIPFITLAVVTGKHFFYVLNNKTKLEHFIDNVLEESLFRTIGGVVVSKTFTVAGSLIMPAAGVVGGAVGGIVGSSMGKKVIPFIKKNTNKTEYENVNRTFKILMDRALKICDQNKKIFEKKFDKTITILQKNSTKRSSELLNYVNVLYEQETIYRNEKRKIIHNVKEKGIEALTDGNLEEAMLNTYVLLQQAGIYLYNLKQELENLHKAFEEYENTNMISIKEAVENFGLKEKSKKIIKKGIEIWKSKFR